MDRLTPDLRYLAWAVILGIVQIILAAYATAAQRPNGLAWAAGSRDAPQPPPTGVAGRLSRAWDNFLETFPLFVAAVLLVHVTGRGGALSAWGAALYFWGRVVFVPLYASGIAYARPVAWAVAMTGIALLLAAALLG